ncbi:hypothetical protein SDC9_192081 [bioreactor metagenome]|uniref:Uncharacterized protein n=1 Tax=bioreactor metagenome TaxID=1076179 RepID=A0A645I0Y7_9ZZZZ
MRLCGLVYPVGILHDGDRVCCADVGDEVPAEGGLLFVGVVEFREGVDQRGVRQRGHHLMDILIIHGAIEAEQRHIAGALERRGSVGGLLDR